MFNLNGDTDRPVRVALHFCRHFADQIADKGRYYQGREDTAITHSPLQCGINSEIMVKHDTTIPESHLPLHSY